MIDYSELIEEANSLAVEAWPSDESVDVAAVLRQGEAVKKIAQVEIVPGLEERRFPYYIQDITHPYPANQLGRTLEQVSARNFSVAGWVFADNMIAWGNQVPSHSWLRQAEAKRKPTIRLEISQPRPEQTIVYLHLLNGSGKNIGTQKTLSQVLSDEKFCHQYPQVQQLLRFLKKVGVDQQLAIKLTS